MKKEKIGSTIFGECNMDDILLNKCTIIENCLKRIREEYVGHEKEFACNFSKQDSIILNLQRACEAAIDLGYRLARFHHLSMPQSSRDVFALLQKEGIIPEPLSEDLQRMVGFRNIAVHDYQQLNLDIVTQIIKTKLINFEKLIDICRQLQ